MEKKEKMICPDCGVEMNLHAEKIDRSGVAEADGSVPTGVDVTVEFHACPRCGLTLERAGV
jgi:ribosomal protein S27AE